MEDTQFYERILGLEEPWKVEAVRMNVAARTVEVELGVEAGYRWKEGEVALIIHGYEARRWRHLDTCQFSTTLCARVPRLLYRDGHTALAQVPWLERAAGGPSCLNILRSA